MDFWPQKPFSIAIVGGGLAGLSLAKGLLKRGVSCQVFEAAPAFAEIGAGLSFALNSLDALKLVDSACYEMLADRCNDMSEKKDVYMTYRDGHNENNDIITTLYCKGSGQQAVHRTLLVKDMVTLMPEGTFHMNKRLKDLVKRPSGGFAVTFEDGTEIEADGVIGSDGIKSTTRQILLGEDNSDAHPKYSGEFGYRSLVPMDDAIKVLGEDFAKNGNVNIGKGALTTTYPVEKGTMFNIVAARHLPTWDHPSWVMRADKESIQEEFKDYGSKMQQVVSLLKEPQKWSLWHHPTAATFYNGRLAIIGDAAHASTPHQGAGCGQAFEDALVMCELLAHDNVKTADDIESAFAAYDAVRRPRTLRVVETSRENGEVCMMNGTDTKDDLTKIKSNLDKRFEWIWYEDLDQQVLDAFRKLNQLMGSSFDESRKPVSCRRNQHDQAAAASVRPGFLRGDSFAAETAAWHRMVKV